MEFYLNTVLFGRGAYGIEAAAQAYLGKTANRNAPPAQQVTMAETMVLVAMVKQPNPTRTTPMASLVTTRPETRSRSKTPRDGGTTFARPLS